MSTAHLHLDSFNAGEISPLASSRFGVEKVASGCRILRNFIIHPHGPAFRRPGMEHLGNAASNTHPSNLRSFQFSSSTVFVLELSASGLRVWQNGVVVFGSPTPLALPYASSEVPEVQMTQINDVVYLTHPNREPRRLTRYADNDWRIEVLPWKNPPMLDENPGSQALPDYFDEVNATDFAPYLNVSSAVFYGLTTANKVTIYGTPPTGLKRIIVESEHFASGSPSPPSGWLKAADVSWQTSLPTPHPITLTLLANPYHNYRIRYQGEGWTSGRIDIETAGGSQLATLSTASPSPAMPAVAILGAGNMRYRIKHPGIVDTGYAIADRANTLILESRPAGGSWSTEASWNLLSAAVDAEVSFWKATTTEFRWRYNAFSAPSSGYAKLYRNSVTTQYQTSIAISAVTGSGRTLTTNRPLFRAGHVGAFWQLTHRRDNAFVEMVTSSAAVAATGVLTFTAISVAAQTVTIGNRIYTWAASVTTTANTVDLGANTAESMANLVAAINGGGGAGSLYGSQTSPHPDVTAAVVGSTVVVTARTVGTGAHSVALTDTMSNASWGGVFMSGGVAANTSIAAAETTGVRVNGTWEVTTYGSWATTLYLERLTASGSWEYVRSWRANKDRNVSATGTTEGEETLRLRILAGTSEEASTAASPRFLLEAVDARVNGLVKITGVGTLNADGMAVTATCDVLSACWDTTPTYVWTEGAFSSHQGFPRAVTFHESRLWFGGTKRQPMRLWASVTGDIENFARTSLDDGGLSFTPNAGELNPVQWMQSQGSDLIVATSGDEWTLSGEGKPITPSNVAFRAQSRYGSSSVPGIMAGEVVAFVQRGGRKVRRIANRSDNTPWATADMTVLAEHIALSGIKQMAYSANPNAILWAVTNDGKLLGLSIEVEQNVFGWHRHDTDGLMESVAVVYGASADEVWLSVLRGANRTIERLDPQVFARDFAAYQTMIYADSAKRITNVSPSTSVTDIGHLNGKTVSILADGVELVPQLVSGGVLTLPTAATHVVVGLPYTSELQPSRREIQTEKGTAQGMLWRPSRAVAYVHESRGGKVLSAPDGRPEAWPYPVASGLYSGPVETAIESNASRSVDVSLRTASLLPFNVGALVLKLDVYGD